MSSALLTRTAIVAVVLLAAVAAGLLKRRADGRFRAGAARGAAQPATDGAPQPAPGPERGATAADPALAALGVTTGTPVTLVQFSSAFCAPCRYTRSLCQDVSARTPGVRHIEVEAESNLDAVRALDIRRTPTLLVVDGTGRVVSRASGQPSRSQLLAAIADLLPA